MWLPSYYRVTHLAEKPKRPLTVRGYKALSEEHNRLFHVERPKVVDGIATAAAEGDRSENAEYIYGKKRLRELDKRIRYLGKLLDEVKVVDPSSLSGSTVCFGSTVTVLTEEGEEKTWTIVGEGETEYTENGISWKSPVAKALLGKQVGDWVDVERPAGLISFEILSLQFGYQGEKSSS